MSILELGAGTGVASIFAATRGARVTLTDGCAEALELAQLNAARNGVEVSVQLLDWFKGTLNSSNSFDMVIAADVVYDDDATTALMTRLLPEIVTQPAQCAVFALELRFNFELESLSVNASGYRRFREATAAGYFEAAKLELPRQYLYGYDRGDAAFELWSLAIPKVRRG